MKIVICVDWRILTLYYTGNLDKVDKKRTKRIYELQLTSTLKSLYGEEIFVDVKWEHHNPAIWIEKDDDDLIPIQENAQQEIEFACTKITVVGKFWHVYDPIHECALADFLMNEYNANKSTLGKTKGLVFTLPNGAEEIFRTTISAEDLIEEQFVKWAESVITKYCS